MTFGDSNNKPLSASYVSLDASRPWIMYWTLHGLDLLNALPSLPDAVLLGILTTLEQCWKQVSISINDNDHQHFYPPLPPTKFTNNNDSNDNDNSNDNVFVGGGFGGGPGQMPHCATTYAAVLTLCILAGYDENTDISKKAVDMLQSKRSALYVWFWSLRCNNNNNNNNNSIGGFHMHHDGEVDVRAAFTIACITTLLNIATCSLFKNTLEYVASCQTFEGGFGSEPNAEAHGGYTFCAIAALHLLQKYNITTTTTNIDYPSLQGWLARRQMTFEGGFSGRSNKLVDGCYSFWQGASMAILDILQSPPLSNNNNNDNDTNTNFWDSGVYSNDYDCPFGVTRQFVSNENTKDETGDSMTMDVMKLQRYILLCAQDINGGLRDKPSKPRDFYHSCYNLSGLAVAQHVLSPQNYGHDTLGMVQPTHVIFNIRIRRLQSILQTFYNHPSS